MRKQQIIDPRFFTNVYWKLLEADTRFVINYGGADSSKSWSQAQKEVIELVSYPGDIMAVRKIGAELYDSVRLQIEQVIDQFGWTDEFRFTFSGSKREAFHKTTGNRIIYKGLDDVAKLKSMLNLRRIWCEEAEELDIEDHNEINRRPRGHKRTQITYTLNPISEQLWIKKHFFDIPEIAEQTTHIFSTIYDNQFADKERIKVLEDYKLYDINQYNIYFLGQWGKPGAKRPFAFAFKEHHIGHGLKFNPRLPVYLSFDFNVDPITCIGAQHNYVKNNLEIRVFKEFRLANSDIYMLCQEIRTYFHETVYFKITGDATGSSRSAMTKGNVNYYTIIKSELRLTNANFDVPTGNPSVKNTRVLLNTLFMRTDFLIDDSCRYLIDDLRYVEVDEHGEVDKRKAEADGMNHLLDCLRYYTFRYHNKYLKHVPEKLVKSK